MQLGNVEAAEQQPSPPGMEMLRVVCLVELWNVSLLCWTSHRTRDVLTNTWLVASSVKLIILNHQITYLVLILLSTMFLAACMSPPKVCVP
jgi:hypothetical protein